MEMLNQEVRDFARKKLEAEMVEPVELAYFTVEKSQLIVPGQPALPDCLYCQETRQLLEELSGLSDKIKLSVYDIIKEAGQAAKLGIDKVPAMAIIKGKDTGIRFFGVPSGYEFMSLLEALVDTSRGQTELSPETKEALKKLNREVNIQIFVTPTCPYCPMAVRLGHQMALESPFIRAAMIEASEFPELAQKYEVMGVPKSIFNETLSLEGAVPEDIYLEHILKATGEQVS
ncbi:MAG: thioredoxin family protein [Acidobacteriota bacterium]|nr:thioredoxin family protein [Acidobacteriota bacterium]